MWILNITYQISTKMNSIHLLKEIAPIDVTCDSCGQEIHTGNEFIANLDHVTIHCLSCAEKLGLVEESKSQDEINRVLNRRVRNLLTAASAC
ncbi:MAG: hypothetical protein CMB80_17565 [Flammeovirgaceae bacterium]|nr:hypothetical protein [Flammeovirgaceae bacterium]HCX21417.1 hypothetical protein [Cytophagales bacterium]|tara:strand:- start:296 stop:571 length:276 start_codon:yes stop_codon:yes gene_type:complete